MVKAIYYILEDKCIGCGACVLIADKLFFIEGGKVKTRKKVLDKEDEIELVKKAKEACPVDAIFVEVLEE